MKLHLPLLLLSVSSLAAAPVSPPPYEEIERLDLDPFYTKHSSVDGFPIVSSDRVSDYAHLEAVYLIDRIIGHRPDILEAITGAKIRFTIMAPGEFTTDVPEHAHLSPKIYWDKRARGLGATPNAPSVSCGEENLLDYPGDPYATENILIHEFGHVIHQIGLKAVDPTFQKRLEQAFNRASLQGLWRSKYAGTNPSEYWAEGVQSWFDCNRENDHDHNHVNTREEIMAHDPGLSALLEEVFGRPEWRYRKPSQRKDPKHLAGYDPSAAPTFSWPAELVAAYETLERGDELVGAKALPLSNRAGQKSAPGGTPASLRIENETPGRIQYHWIDFEGETRSYGWIDPGRRSKQNTFAGHLWLITDESGREIALASAPARDGKLVVRRESSPR